MNLHDKRFSRKTNPAEEWNHVCIPNKFRAAKIKASIDTGGYYVSLVSVHPRQSGVTGRPPQHDVLHFRGNSPAELREIILKSFPDAVFTNVANSEPDELKAQFRAEQKAALERSQKAADAKQFDGLVVSEHRKIERTLTRAQQLEAANQSINLFVNDVAYSSPQWIAWFRQHVRFFSYPDNSSKNRDTLLKFCESRGQIVPRTEEIASAMNYLLQHGHFYMKPSYKRSESDEKNSVQPFVREVPLSETISQEQIREAVRRLIAKFGIPVSVSIERLQACGVPNPEAMFAKIQSIYSAEPIADKSTEELKGDLQAMRNAARGTVPRSFRDNAKGY